MAAQVVQSPLVNPFDSEEAEVAPPATTKPKKKTQFAATTNTTTVATNPFPEEGDEHRVLHPRGAASDRNPFHHDDQGPPRGAASDRNPFHHDDQGPPRGAASDRNPFHHDDQGPVSSNVAKATLRPCKSMAVNYNAATGGKPESKLTKHMSISSSPYTPFGKAAAATTTTTSSASEAPHHKSTLVPFNLWHPFGHKNATVGDHTAGTRRKEVMGAEGRGTKASRDVFGHDDADSDECENCRGKKAVFGSEDVGYETGKDGRNLVGDEDEDGVVNSTSREVFGSGGDADGTNRRKAGEVFGDYDGEEEDDDEYAPTAPSVDEFVNKAVADLRGLTLTQATTTTLVTKTVEVTEAK